MYDFKGDIVIVMNTLRLSGTIKYQYDDWDRLILIQEDGYKIDLISRLRELLLNTKTDEVQINYHLSDRPMTLIEAKENHIKRISGALESDYEANSYSFSSLTSGTDYDTTLEVGGHSLYRELKSEEHRFVIFEVNYNPA